MPSSSRPRPSPRSGKSTATSRSPEGFQSLNERNIAANILQSYEKLSWFSMQRCESLTQTRLHFLNIVAGFTSEDEAALVHWKDDLAFRGEAAKISKGKERVSDVDPTSASRGNAMASASASAAKKKRRSDGRTVS